MGQQPFGPNRHPAPAKCPNRQMGQPPFAGRQKSKRQTGTRHLSFYGAIDAKVCDLYVESKVLDSNQSSFAITDFDGQIH